MAETDKTNETATAEETVNGTEESEVDVETMKAELEKTKAEIERLKKEKSGVDKSNSEYVKKLKEIENAKLSAEELTQKQLKEMKAELEAKNTELLKRETDDKKRVKLRAAGLSESLATKLSGSTDEEIDEAVKDVLKAFEDKRVKENAEKAGANAHTPRAASGSYDKIDDDIKRLRKEGTAESLRRADVLCKEKREREKK